MALTQPSLILFLLTLSGFPLKACGRDTWYFDRDACLAYTSKLQQNPSFSMNTSEYFAYDEASGSLLSGYVNMTLTLRGCDEFCGPPSFYFDALPRLTIWILPVFVLLSNIELSPIDKKRFMTILHALGDPIDSFWSITHKIYVWERLFEIGLTRSPPSSSVRKFSPRTGISLRSRARHFWLAILSTIGIVRLRYLDKAGNPTDKPGPEIVEGDINSGSLSRGYRARIIATVLSGFEEVVGSRIGDETYYDMILHKCGRIGSESEDPAMFEEWRKCARSLADARTNEYVRTCVAIVFYFVGLIAAFVPAIGGGGGSPPGGRIGSAVFLSWLIPLALLTNRVGAFTSRRICLSTMMRFVEATLGVEDRVVGGSASDEVWRRTEGNISPTLTKPREMHTTFQNWSFATDSNSTYTDFVNGGDEDSSRWARNLELRLINLNHGIKHSSSDHMDLSASFDGRDADIGHQSDLSINDTIHLLHSNQHQQGQHTERGDMYDVELSDIPARQRRYEGLRSETHDQESPLGQISLLRFNSWDEYFSSLQWLGSIYTYRPWKYKHQHINHVTHTKSTKIMLVLVGILNVLLSAAAASAIMWDAIPAGFSCRNVWVAGFFGIWIVSATITTGAQMWLDARQDPNITHDRRQNRQSAVTGLEHRVWAWILVKDSVIAVSCGLTILLSTAGVFNSCYCWSVYLTKRRDQAVIPMNTDKQYEARAVQLYSGIVISCIGLQILLFFAVAGLYRNGLSIVRWHEDDKLREWKESTEPDAMAGAKGELIFWCYRKDLDTEEDQRRRKASEYSLGRQRSGSVFSWLKIESL